MPSRPLASDRLRAARVTLAFVALFAAAGCSKVPVIGKSALHVKLAATADLNSCGKSIGYPLSYRVLQLTDASLLTGMTLPQLWDKEEKLLGPAFLAKTDGSVDPGQKSELPVSKDPKAKFMVVVGNFCKTRGSCWYFVQPLNKGGSVKLSAGASCFEAAK